MSGTSRERAGGRGHGPLGVRAGGAAGGVHAGARLELRHAAADRGVDAQRAMGDRERDREVARAGIDVMGLTTVESADDLEDLRERREPPPAAGAAQHDMKQLRRHSSFTDADWRKLVYFYEAAFGSSIKGLES